MSKQDLVELVERENRKLKSSFKFSPAYWISPDNFVIPLPDTHIELIITNPEKFGISKDYVSKIYKKHKEPMGVEGNARNEIMTDLVHQGWIRMRLHPREMVWVAQVPKLDTVIGRRIESWSQGMIKNYPKSRNATIQVVDLEANPIISYMEDIRLEDVSKSSKRWRQYTQSSGRLSLAQQFHEMVFMESISVYPGMNKK